MSLFSLFHLVGFWTLFLKGTPGRLSNKISKRWARNWSPFFLRLSSAKNIFRVRFQDPSPGQSHTLQANDVFHKQQWVNCIRTAVAPFQRTAAAAELKELPELSEESEENNPSASNVKAHKRQSAGVTEMELDENAGECGSILDSEEAKGAKTHRTSFGHRKMREKQLSGKRKETLV